MEQKIEILMKCPLFQGLSPSETEEMLSCIRPRKASFQKGEIILHAGEPLQAIGIVLAGEINITKETLRGEQVILHKVSAGEMFGEMAALSDRPFAPATLFSCTESEIIWVPVERILNPCTTPCGSHLKLLSGLVRITANRAVYLNRKIDLLVIKSMRGRLCTYLYSLYQQTGGKRKLRLSLSRGELADFLNVSRPSMSRELGRMRDEGMLSFHGRVVELLDLERIQYSAE